VAIETSNANRYHQGGSAGITVVIAMAFQLLGVQRGRMAGDQASVAWITGNKVTTT